MNATRTHMTVPATTDHCLGPAVRIHTLDPRDAHQMDDGRWCVWAHEFGRPEKGEHITAKSAAALMVRLRQLRGEQS